LEELPPDSCTISVAVEDQMEIGDSCRKIDFITSGCDTVCRLELPSSANIIIISAKILPYYKQNGRRNSHLQDATL
jgi:hypothetical protein